MNHTENFYFRTENLTVGYNGVPLIRDINIRIRPGEILTLIGPNGAGKTTILKSIIRQLAPIAGTVYLEGKRMDEISPSALSEKLSVVLTERPRPERMSCEDVVATGRYPYTGKFGVLNDHDREVVRTSIELVHIQELTDCDFDKISDGQKQRVMLARALCQEPEIIVLDEPTSFLDIRYKLEFLSVLQKMTRKKRLSVILSLHELDLAERVSDRIACVRGDRIDRVGTPEEVFSGGYIQELYGMTVGSFGEVTGNTELEAVRGKPEVFVIAGCGTGTAVFRRLQREAVPFATGILYENDLDYPAAAALASEVISVRPFAPMNDSAYQRAREVMDGCEEVICTLPVTAGTKQDCAGNAGRKGIRMPDMTPGSQGEMLYRLYREAVSQGKIRNPL